MEVPGLRSRKEHIRVIARFRPLDKKEKKSKDKICTSVTGTTIKIESNSKSHKYNFDDVLSKDINQEQTFDRVAVNICKSVLNGFNGSIITYGQTGTGKTYSLFGLEIDNDAKSIGIIQRAASFFFAAIEQSQDIDEAELRVSFLEIYKETLRDLCPKTAEYAPLKIRKQSNGDTEIEGLNKTQVTSLNEILKLLNRANSKRTQIATKKGKSSPRSHYIITFHLSLRKTVQAGGYTINSKMQFCDLGGSEKMKELIKIGKKTSETPQLNEEIITLQRCIECMVDRLPNIPFEDSNLTKILKDSIAGNTITTLLINITEHELNYNETLLSLKFGARSKLIRTTIIPNKILTSGQTTALLNQLKRENEKLKQGINIDDDNNDDIKNDNDINNEIASLKLKNRKLQEEADEWRHKYNKADKLASKAEGDDDKLADLEIELDNAKKTIDQLQNENKNLALFNVLLAETINQITDGGDDYKKDSYNADKLTDLFNSQREGLETDKKEMIDALKELEFTNDNAKEIYTNTYDKISDLSDILDAQQQKLFKLESKLKKKDEEIEYNNTQLNDLKSLLKEKGIDSGNEMKDDYGDENIGGGNRKEQSKYLKKIASEQQQKWEVEEDKAWKKFFNEKAQDLGFNDGKSLIKDRKLQAKRDYKDGKIDKKPTESELISDIRDEFYILYDTITGDIRNPNELVDDDIKKVAKKGKNKLIDDPMDWDIDSITKWLKDIQLDKYCKNFADDEIDGKILLIDLDQVILKRELKVKGMHVDKFMREIKELRDRSPGYKKYLIDQGLDDDKLLKDEINIDNEFENDNNFDNENKDEIFELTEEEKKYGTQFWALEELFDILDINESGKLDIGLFKHGLHALNVELMDEEMDFLFNQIIGDKDKDVNYIEFKQFLEHFQFTDYLPPQTQKYSNAILESVPRISSNRKSYVTRAAMVVKYGIKYNNTKTEINNYLLNKGLKKSEIDAAWKQYRFNPKSIRDIDFKSLNNKKNKIVPMNIKDKNVEEFNDFKLYKLLKRAGFKNFNSKEFNDIDFLRASGNNSKVLSVKCWFDIESAYFNGLQFIYQSTNGQKVKGPKNFVKQGKPVDDSINLNNGEYIVNITVYFKHFICGITIDTNISSKNFGTRSDDAYTLQAPSGTCIMAVYGSINRLFDTLGCYCVRISENKVKKQKKKNKNEGDGQTTY